MEGFSPKRVRDNPLFIPWAPVLQVRMEEVVGAGRKTRWWGADEVEGPSLTLPSVEEGRDRSEGGSVEVSGGV